MDDVELATRLAMDMASADPMAGLPGLESADDGGAASGAGIPAMPPGPTAAVPAAGSAVGPGAPLDPNKIKNWTTIYPCYINVDRKCSDGRRLPKAKLAGCTDPHPMEIAQALGSLGFTQIAVEGHKRHPCDPFVFGRVRFSLKKEDGSYCVPALTSKAQILEQVAARLPGLEIRRQRFEHMARMREEHEKRLREAPGAARALGAAKKAEEKKGKKPGKR